MDGLKGAGGSVAGGVKGAGSYLGLGGNKGDEPAQKK